MPYGEGTYGGQVGRPPKDEKREKLKKIAKGGKNDKAMPMEKGQQQQQVVDGDTLWGIARQYGFATNKGVSELIKLNPHIKDKDKIYPCDKINIPNKWLNK
jgi:nucleoid-associated protein YgaU